MDFIEEHSPAGITLKIFFEKNSFLAFTQKGRSIYPDEEQSTSLFKIPLLIFVGRMFKVKKEHTNSYTILKIRDNKILVPYIDLHDNKSKFIFMHTTFQLDMMPVRIEHISDVPTMVKGIDVNAAPDYILIDSTITSNDIIIIKNRYKVDDIIHLEHSNNFSIFTSNKKPEEDRVVNLNMMSTNPVFLSRIHLRKMDLSKINQLLLDFELTALDAEYIMTFINDAIDKAEMDANIQKNLNTLIDLKNAFTFYLYLLQRNDEKIRNMIVAIDDAKKVAPYRTLIMKVKSIYPGREEQLLYTDYENYIMDQKQHLLTGDAPISEETLPPENTEEAPESLTEDTTETLSETEETKTENDEVDETNEMLTEDSNTTDETENEKQSKSRPFMEEINENTNLEELAKSKK